MDYRELKNFKLRYFILFAVVVFIASTIVLLMTNIPASEQIITFITSIFFLSYLLYQTKKWNITYNEQLINSTMSKGRWARYLSVTASIQLITVVFTTLLLIGLYILFEEQIRSFLSFFPVIEITDVQPSLLMYVLFFLNICVLAPIYEELFFRGILLRRFTLKWSPQKSIIISSIIFGIIHFNPINVVFAFALGCVLGYAYLKTKNIFVPMLLHSFSNFLAFLQFVYANQTTVLELPSTEAAQRDLLVNGAFFILLTAILVFLLVKYYKNFRQFKMPPPKIEQQIETEPV